MSTIVTILLVFLIAVSLVGFSLLALLLVWWLISPRSSGDRYWK